LVGSDIKSTQCLGLEMFRRSLDYAEVGENVGILIRSIKKDEVSRGFILSTPGIIKPYNEFIGKVYILTKKEGGRHKGFGNNYKPQFFFRTANVTGAIAFLNNISFIMPGESGEIKVLLVDKLPLTLGLSFIMREGNLTVGAGVITNLSV
jgi:elongation factor Tu